MRGLAVPADPLTMFVDLDAGGDTLALDDEGAELVEDQVVYLSGVALMLQTEAVEDEEIFTAAEGTAEVEDHLLLGRTAGLEEGIGAGERIEFLEDHSGQ